jgi:hypothetical protein
VSTAGSEQVLPEGHDAHDDRVTPPGGIASTSIMTGTRPLMTGVPPFTVTETSLIVYPMFDEG